MYRWSHEHMAAGFHVKLNFLGSALLVYAIRAHKLHVHYPTLAYYIFIINYPLGSMALYGSIYSTLGLSIERFLGE